MKRQKVEAWAVCREGDGEVRAIESTRSRAIDYGNRDASAGRFSIVHLIEASPATERVVKAAVVYVDKSTKSYDDWRKNKNELDAAVEAHQKATRKKR